MEIMDEIKELKRQKIQFEANLRALLETHLKMIETEKEREEELTAIEEKLKFKKFMEQPNGKTLWSSAAAGEEKAFAKADLVVNVIGVEQVRTLSLDRDPAAFEHVAPV
jgi:cell division septum initiation protein DivIVA